MLTLGPAKKITIYLNEDTSSSRDFLYREIFEFLLAQGVGGASLIRPDAGFGIHHRIHSQHGEGVTGQHLPVQIEFIETPERFQAILPELMRITTDGLIEAQDTTVLKLSSREPIEF
jgi:PII-like signaling protein